MLSRIAESIKYDYIDKLFVTDANKHCPYCIIWFALVVHTTLAFLFGLGIGISNG